MRRRTFTRLLGAGIPVTHYLTKAAASAQRADSADRAKKATLVLWDDVPATEWEDAYPIGNGRLGAMVFGGPWTERIQLNEDTLTSDEPGQRYVPLDYSKGFDEVAALLRDGQYAEADEYITKNWLGRVWPCYQPMADLFLDFGVRGFIEDYRRELDLADGVSRVSYRLNSAVHIREVFASFPDQVIVVHVHATRPGLLDLRARLDCVHPTAKITTRDDGTLVLKGQAPGFCIRRTLEYIEEKNDQHKYPEIFDQNGKRKPFAKQVLYGDEVDGRGTFFETHLRARTTSGNVSVVDGSLVIRGADEVILLLSAGTSFNGVFKSPSRGGADPSIRARADLDAAWRKTYFDLESAHTKDYQTLFDRVSMTIGQPAEQSLLPTKERLQKYENGQDASLAVLYFQFGRYLMIAGSRPGSQALNLQGIWNEKVIPPWACGYTNNINTQMHYWPAEIGNLSECHEPLLRLIRETAVNGKKEARQTYHRPGWVMHHNTTLWRGAQIVDNLAQSSFFPLAGGWLVRHLWEHYLHSGDREFLAKEAYPLIRGAAEFIEAWLVEDKNGKLMTPVSTSPENRFSYTDRQGKKRTASTSPGSTIDLAITREVFAECIEAAKILGMDQEFARRLEAKRERIHPFQIGRYGQLQEWVFDFDEPSPGFGHVSHLYPLYPGNQIRPRKTPELAKAAEVALERRQSHGAGRSAWPAAWYINLWARLENAEQAHARLVSIFKNRSTTSLLNARRPGGPPWGTGRTFQIDANMGGCAGIAEMLLQSHGDEIRLLPALPKAWPDGEVRGLVARGGFEVGIRWSGGRLQQASLLSKLGNSCRTSYGTQSRDLDTAPGKVYRLDSRLSVI